MFTTTADDSSTVLVVEERKDVIGAMDATAILLEPPALSPCLLRDFRPYLSMKHVEIGLRSYRAWAMWFIHPANSEDAVIDKRRPRHHFGVKSDVALDFLVWVP